MKAFVLGIILIFNSDFSFAASKDVFSIGISAEFETLNPLIASQAATKYMLYLAYRPLVILTPDGKFVPTIIKKIPTIENKLVKTTGEKMNMTFEFIEKVTWGDGTPVTCKDVEFAWQVGKNKNVSNANREPYENITAITWDKKNEKKCNITFAKSKFDYFLNIPDPLPEHLEGPVFKKFQDKPEGYDLNTLYTKDPTNPGLYYGPYRISEVKLGSHVIFTQNPNFYGKKPFFKKIIFKLIPNNNTLVANLRSKNIDMICPAGGLGIDQAFAFEKTVKSDNLPFKVIFEDGVIYAHIDLNLENPALSDLRVRKAISHAFSRKEIIQSLMENKAKEAIHFVTERDPWYTKNVPTYAFNKQESARLLDDAGWKMGTKGYREKNGKRLSLTIMAAAGAKINELIETYLQFQFKSVGVELLIKNEPARVFFGETTRHRKFDMALFAWSSIPENSPRSNLHSTSIPTEKNTWMGQNYTGYNNNNVDKLIDTLEQELNTKKRAEIAKKILKHYAEDIPVIPVYMRPSTSVVPVDLKGYRLSGHMFYESLNAEDWYL